MIDTISRIAALASQYGVLTIAIGAGIAPDTLRKVLARAEMPARPHARAALIRFAELNADARTRSDLRFVS